MSNNVQNLNKDKINREIGESTFIMWKSELQKELPSFWEIMNKF